MINPITKAISTLTLLLAASVLTLMPNPLPGGVVSQSTQPQTITIYSFQEFELNNLTIYQYEANINNTPATIQLEATNQQQQPEIIKKKEKTIHKEDGKETHNETEYEYNPSKLPEQPTQPKTPGKVKIIFKDSKQQGTTLIYERDMSDGEISPTDQAYIEKVLTSVEKFHRDNHTINDKLKETINNFFNSIKKKR